MEHLTIYPLGYIFVEVKLPVLNFGIYPSKFSKLIKVVLKFQNDMAPSKIEDKFEWSESTVKTEIKRCFPEKMMKNQTPILSDKELGELMPYLKTRPNKYEIFGGYEKYLKYEKDMDDGLNLFNMEENIENSLGYMIFSVLKYIYESSESSVKDKKNYVNWLLSINDHIEIEKVFKGQYAELYDEYVKNNGVVNIKEGVCIG